MVLDSAFQSAFQHFRVCSIRLTDLVTQPQQAERGAVHGRQHGEWRRAIGTDQGNDVEPDRGQ
jgi:hypothetical protein